MAIDIKINLDLSPRQKKIVRAAVVAGAVIGALGIGIAIAAPVQWTASETLTQAKMNAITVVTNGSVSYSVGATKYCGTGPTNTTGAISYDGATGYAGAKAMCQASTGCGSSPTAHMCSSEEIARSLQLGINPAPGSWYATAIASITPYTGIPPMVDCQGFTNSTTSQYGVIWGGSGAPGSDTCNASLPVLCCD